MPYRFGQASEEIVRTPLASALHERQPQHLPLRRDDRRRPYLAAPYSDYGVSWSHSGELLLLAVGKQLRLGIDTELKRRRPRARDLAKRYFHADETRRLQRSDDPNDDFLRLWCAKEAILKAHGDGIAFGLDRVVFAFDGHGPDSELRLVHCDPALGNADQWQLREWTPAPDYLAMLAWRHHF